MTFVLLLLCCTTLRLPGEVQELLVPGAHPSAVLHEDFDGDGNPEWAIVEVIVDASNSQPMSESRHIRLSLVSTIDGRPRLTSQKEMPGWGRESFTRLDSYEMKGDGTRQIAVTWMNPGADNWQDIASTFDVNEGRLHFLRNFVGVCGGIEFKDYDDDGRIEAKTWTWGMFDWSNRGYLHVTTFMRWNGRSFVTYRSYVVDSRTGRQRPADRTALECANIDFGYETEVCDAQALTGSPILLTEGMDLCGSPEWSPDGKKIAFLAGSGYYEGGRMLAQNVWVMDADGQGKRKLTSFVNCAVTALEWSKDGKTLSFERVVWGDDTPYEHRWTVDVKSSSTRELKDGENWSSYTNLSSAGKLVEEHFTDRSFHVMTGSKAYRLVFKPGLNASPVVSEDRKWIAFMSYKDKTWGVWKIPMPD